MSIKITAEELTKQYLNGKSIKQLSQETGKGEWAIRKQIQRYLYRQHATQEIQPEYKEQVVTLNRRQKPLTKFAATIAAIGFMLALFFLYIEIKKRKDNSDR